MSAGGALGQHGGVAAGAAAAPAEEKTEFSVVLTNVGSNKINVIKVVREVTSLGLKEAKDLVDGAPKTVKEGVTKQEAEEIDAELDARDAAREAARAARAGQADNVDAGGAVDPAAVAVGSVAPETDDTDEADRPWWESDSRLTDRFKGAL